MKTTSAFRSFLVAAPLLAVPILGLSLCLPAHGAVTYTWTGGTDTSWTNAANWDANGVPVDFVPANGLEFDPASGDRIVINATTNSPTTNLPALYAVNGTSVIPTIDVVNGTASFSASTNLAAKGLVNGSGYSATVGDGDTGNGLASLTYTVATNVLRTSPMAMLVKSDGAVHFNNPTVLSYSSTSVMQMTLAGGSVTFSAMTDLLRDGAGAGPGSSYFDFTAAGATFTSDIGVGDFVDITAINALIGDGLTFRSSTALTLAAQDNGNGTFSVTVVPEPGAALLCSLGLLLIPSRRR